MVLNENTKNGPEQNQAQAEPGPAAPDVMQRESPRQCKICGSPNHQGCGCEARQLREAKEAGLTENEAKALQEPEQPASEAPEPVEEPVTSDADNELEKFLSAEAIIESQKASMQMAKDVKTMADGFEGLCALMYDTNNYLKIIAGDLIKIRKFHTREDEVNNAGENQD